MKRPQVNCATPALGCQKLWKGRVQVIGDNRSDLFSLLIWNNEKVAGAGCIPIVIPPNTWVHAWLRASRRGGGMFLFCSGVHAYYIELVSSLVQNEGCVLDLTYIMDT